MAAIFVYAGVPALLQGLSVTNGHPRGYFDSRATNIFAGLVALTAGFVGGPVAAFRPRIVLTVDDLVVHNALWSKRIRRQDLLWFDDSRFGVVVSYESNGRRRNFTASAGQGVLGVRLFGRTPRSQSVSKQLNEILELGPLR